MCLSGFCNFPAWICASSLDVGLQIEMKHEIIQSGVGDSVYFPEIYQGEAEEGMTGCNSRFAFMKKNDQNLIHRIFPCTQDSQNVMLHVFPNAVTGPAALMIGPLLDLTCSVLLWQQSALFTFIAEYSADLERNLSRNL